VHASERGACAVGCDGRCGDGMHACAHMRAHVRTRGRERERARVRVRVRVRVHIRVCWSGDHSIERTLGAQVSIIQGKGATK
jgi:hypothetical protein